MIELDPIRNDFNACLKRGEYYEREFDDIYEMNIGTRPKKLEPPAPDRLCDCGIYVEIKSSTKPFHKAMKYVGLDGNWCFAINNSKIYRYIEWQKKGIYKPIALAICFDYGVSAGVANGWRFIWINELDTIFKNTRKERTHEYENRDKADGHNNFSWYLKFDETRHIKEFFNGISNLKLSECPAKHDRPEPEVLKTKRVLAKRTTRS